MKLAVAVTLVVLLLAAVAVAAYGSSLDQWAQAAYFIRLARDSHAQWSAFYRAFPAEKERLVKQAVCNGDEVFHDMWVVRYDLLLKTLEGR